MFLYMREYSKQFTASCWLVRDGNGEYRTYGPAVNVFRMNSWSIAILFYWRDEWKWKATRKCFILSWKIFHHFGVELWSLHKSWSVLGSFLGTSNFTCSASPSQRRGWWWLKYRERTSQWELQGGHSSTTRSGRIIPFIPSNSIVLLRIQSRHNRQHLNIIQNDVGSSCSRTFFRNSFRPEADLGESERLKNVDVCEANNLISSEHTQ